MMSIFVQRTQRTVYPVGGFSLVETLVAVSILMLVVIGPLTITARTAKSSTFSAEQVTAQFLAQEGIELAQKSRDDLLLEEYKVLVGGGDGDPWEKFVLTTGTGRYQHCFGTNGCGLSMSNTSAGQLTVVQCVPNSASNPCRLWLSTDANARSRFTHTSTGAEATLYTRTIRFTRDAVNFPNEVLVVSEVTWRTGSLLATQRVRVETTLFNVYENVFRD